ncbi:hypothetical protein R3P38DRAFT_2782529 [Favolaschia claudopus]|uniref:Uncharacterized protein n=1 Tax=Favolaschia claudopus TaxID=2862362 RepID=A0AAW0B304_9AGAR
MVQFICIALLQIAFIFHLHHRDHNNYDGVGLRGSKLRLILRFPVNKVFNRLVTSNSVNVHGYSPQSADSVYAIVQYSARFGTLDTLVLQSSTSLVRIGYGCERELKSGLRVLFNKPLLDRNHSTIYRDYHGRNYDCLNSTLNSTTVLFRLNPESMQLSFVTRSTHLIQPYTEAMNRPKPWQFEIRPNLCPFDLNRARTSAQIRSKDSKTHIGIVENSVILIVQFFNQECAMRCTFRLPLSYSLVPSLSTLGALNLTSSEVIEDFADVRAVTVQNQLENGVPLYFNTSELSILCSQIQAAIFTYAARAQATALSGGGVDLTNQALARTLALSGGFANGVGVGPRRKLTAARDLDTGERRSSARAFRRRMGFEAGSGGIRAAYECGEASRRVVERRGFSGVGEEAEVARGLGRGVGESRKPIRRLAGCSARERVAAAAWSLPYVLRMGGGVGDEEGWVGRVNGDGGCGS